jgi:hypothetical protein
LAPGIRIRKTIYGSVPVTLKRRKIPHLNDGVHEAGVAEVGEAAHARLPVLCLASVPVPAVVPATRRFQRLHSLFIPDPGSRIGDGKIWIRDVYHRPAFLDFHFYLVYLVNMSVLFSYKNVEHRLF